MNSKFKNDRSLYYIKRFIKDELWYTYKRGSSRVPLASDSKLKYLHWIFGLMIMNLISDGWTIINIDEASYTRSIKMDYSWLPRGYSNAIVNTLWRGRAFVIFALISRGEWIVFLGNKTTNSWNFIKFIFILSKYWEMWLYFKENEVIITLDNAAIHRSSRTKWAAELLKTPLHFLPPYSPNLAPTEWIFGLSKRMIDTKSKVMSITLLSIMEKDS